MFSVRECNSAPCSVEQDPRVDKLAEGARQAIQLPDNDEVALAGTVEELDRLRSLGPNGLYSPFREATPCRGRTAAYPFAAAASVRLRGGEAAGVRRARDHETSRYARRIATSEAYSAGSRMSDFTSQK